MPTRREFLGAVAAGASAAACAGPGVVRSAEAAASLSAADNARDEDFWAEIQRAYSVDRSAINLNNGGVSPSPGFVQDAMERHLRFSNELPSHNLWDVLQPQREEVRVELARQFGCDAEEIAITRNASEGLQTCQLGFDLEPGDEVLCTELDYPRMLTTFRQRERRDGVRLVTFPIPAPNEDLAAIVDLYRRRLSERTKLILCCHVISVTGQVLPVREIVALGRDRGIPVIVDGAHAFGHLDFSVRDLDCDYYATSLHKWMCAPHGNGMLYVRRDKIGSLWPLMAAPAGKSDDVRKFEEVGTQPLANSLAIREALAFHKDLGAQRKLARLVHLRDSWIDRLTRHERVRLLTNVRPGFAGGMAAFTLRGVKAFDLTAHLWKVHRIKTSWFRMGEFGGVRVSPHVYTKPSEIGRFCDAMDAIIRGGIPS